MVWLCFSELFLNWHLHENVNQSKITWNFNVIPQIGPDCFFKYNSLKWYLYDTMSKFVVLSLPALYIKYEQAFC